MESPPSRRPTGPDPGLRGKDAYVPHAIEWTSERVGRVWDFYGRLDGADALYFSANNSRALLDFLNARLPLAKRRILDFGCGRGALLEGLCSRGVRCAGLEFSRETAATAKARLHGNESALFPVGVKPGPQLVAGSHVLRAHVRHGLPIAIRGGRKLERHRSGERLFIAATNHGVDPRQRVPADGSVHHR